MNRSKYMEEYYKINGVLRVQINTIAGGQSYIIYTDNVLDEYEIKACKKGLEEVKKYFERNNYYIEEIKHIEGLGITYKVYKEIKRWNKVDINILNILKRALNKNKTIVVKK